MARMFEWDDARHFLAIHRSGSLSAAARQLGVNQSTVGRRLLALEEHLGARLFVRTRDGYRIAPAGARLLPHAERMEDEAIAIGRELAGQERTLTGRVRITAPDMFGPRVVAPLLARFHQRHPDIELELDTTNEVRNLRKLEADIAVRIGIAAEHGTVVRKLAPFGKSAYACAAYLAARGRPKLPACEGHDFIGFSEPLREILESRWIEARSKARVVFRTHSTAAQLQAALDGVGIALLPCYVGDAEPDLTRVAPPSSLEAQSVWLAVHEDMKGAAPIRACADFLAEGIRSQARRLAGRAEVG